MKLNTRYVIRDDADSSMRDSYPELECEKNFRIPTKRELADNIKKVAYLDRRGLLNFWDEAYGNFLKKYGRVPILLDLLRFDGDFKMGIGSDSNFIKMSDLDSTFLNDDWDRIRAGAARFYLYNSD